MALYIAIENKSNIRDKHPADIVSYLISMFRSTVKSQCSPFSTEKHSEREMEKLEHDHKNAIKGLTQQ